MSDETPAEQWNASAEGWARWAARATGYLVPATESMLDLARVRSGSRVLDVGCGSGEQTVIAARRVGGLRRAQAFQSIEEAVNPQAAS